MHVAMLRGMLLMALPFWMYAIGAALTRVRSIILERERARAGCGAQALMRPRLLPLDVVRRHGVGAWSPRSSTLRLRRARAPQLIEEERDLEAQD